MASVAVVGAGIVGSTAALLAAAEGHRVTLVDAQEAPWLGASGANEGKIHLGPIFALGDARTHRLMLESAVAFAPLLERAVGHAIDWDAIASVPFRYLVMDGSLADPDELAARYSAINDLAASLGARTYLGHAMPRVVDTSWVRDEQTGLPGFDVAERSVDPLALRTIVAAALADADIASLWSTRVAEVDQRPDVAWLVTGAGERVGPFDAVVNATWERQHELVDRAHRHPLNFRVKAAVRVPRHPSDRALTLVHGPYGDAVALPAYTYLSWYPVGRLVHEEGWEPSAAVDDALRGLRDNGRVLDVTLEALRAHGIWRGDAEGAELTGGVILGHGALDIDRTDSSLHSRAEFGVTAVGRLLTPVSYKFTSAPLAASRVVDALGEIV